MMYCIVSATETSMSVARNLMNTYKRTREYLKLFASSYVNIYEISCDKQILVAGGDVLLHLA